MTPPAALISSIASSVASRTDVSLIAIVPLSECSTPTLIVTVTGRRPGRSGLLGGLGGFRGRFRGFRGRRSLFRRLRGGAPAASGAQATSAVATTASRLSAAY